MSVLESPGLKGDLNQTIRDLSSSDDSSGEEDEEKEEETMSEMLEKFMLQDENIKIEDDLNMRENIRNENCLAILIKFITEPFFTPVSSKWGSKYKSEKYDGLILDISPVYSVEESIKGDLLASKGDYDPMRHNSYYFRSQAAAMLLTNIRNYKFIAKNSYPFIETFCKFSLF